MMQQRYCTCGQRVLVRYSNRFGSWNPQFIVGHESSKRVNATAHTCPNCGAPLNIHQLR